MPDPETDVELPIEDAVEQEQAVEAGQEPPPVPTAPAAVPLEADEADVADQQSVVDSGDDDYR